MSDQEKANANENPCKRIIEELSALDNAMNKHQCYTCHYEFIDVVENFGTNILAEAIAYLKAIDRDTEPTVDAVTVVRCKDCKHYLELTFYAVCTKHDLVVEPNDYCSDGERKDKA